MGTSTRGREIALERCRRYRRHILDLSQRGVVLHIAPAFSCLELVDAVYHELMRRDGETQDTFILSKGHGCLSQYVILEELGVLTAAHLEAYCKPGGSLGSHPDYGVPGIEATTGIARARSRRCGRDGAGRRGARPGSVRLRGDE